MWAARLFGVVENPDIRSDAGVEKEVVRHGDDGIHEVVLEQEATDLAFATSRGAGAAGYFALALEEALFDADKADEVKRAVVMDIV